MRVRRQSSVNRQAGTSTTVRSGKWRWSAPSAACALLIVAALLAGCRSPREQIVARPTRHSIRSEQMLVLTDFKLAKSHPLVQDLIELRAQVAETLELPEQGEDVTVYIFDSEAEYRKYLEATWPDLPERRAYFIGTPKELAVYTYWGDRIQEDLRHEYTHGLLHAHLDFVPLWLDEGLAEYFEVIGPEPGSVNVEYASRLATSLKNGWQPDLDRLERLEGFAQMQRTDYQEAWAWVHFMLHSSPDTRQVLLDYLRELDAGPELEPLSGRLARELPALTPRFLAYLGTLSTTGRWTETL
ncbi:MAG: hypothetical protein ACREJB_13745 [Planctomycetaceae bacterium]